MAHLLAAFALASLTVLTQGQTSSNVTNANIRSDPMTKGPPLEVVHLYNGQWPTGITVSSTGRKFSCFPAGLDPANVYLGLNPVYQVQELNSDSTEVPYPNASYNLPPGGAIDITKIPPMAKGDPNHLIGVQSVVLDSQDTLWILDTGRVLDLANPATPMLHSQHGGPKVVSVDIATNTVTRTIVFPSNVAFPDSYPNDVRIDRSRGFLYISDSSLEGRNGIIVVNLANGQSWRHLDNSPTVHSISGSVPFVYGAPMYQESSEIKLPGYITFGVDGITLSPDGNTLYYSVIGGRFLYSVPTALLRVNPANDAGATAAANAAVTSLGEKGISDGLETDSNGVIYGGNAEQDAIFMRNPSLTNYTTIFVRDPRINWVDTLSVATDGYLYFTVNQLNDLLAIYPGTGLPGVDRRQRPFVAFRAKLPAGGTKTKP